MPVYAWLMPFIGIVAIVSFFLTGNIGELVIGVIALVGGFFIYRRRFL